MTSTRKDIKFKTWHQQEKNIWKTFVWQWFAPLDLFCTTPRHQHSRSQRQWQWLQLEQIQVEACTFRKHTCSTTPPCATTNIQEHVDHKDLIQVATQKVISKLE